MDEHRTHARHRTLKAGKIVFNHKSSVVDCTIRNMSDGGALLQLTSTLGIPDDFELVCEIDHVSRACKVEWKTENRLGVSFY